MTFSGIIVAAGSGSRAGGGKQWRLLAGRPVLRWSAEAMIATGQAAEVLVAAPADEISRAEAALAGLPTCRVVEGGLTRAHSVRAALAALDCGPDEIVLIHDAARPLLTPQMIATMLREISEGEADGAAFALPVADSLRRADERSIMEDEVDRTNLWRLQTPQGFRRRIIEAAYESWTGAQPPTDETVVVQRVGGKIRLLRGDSRLMKLTYPEDFAMAEALMPRQTRIGSGFDVHRWGPGDRVWLCGVEILHDQTLIGHSDADAGLHAVTDALLGAIGEGDIGDHFPPTDPRWKGASSDQFLTEALDRVRSRGGRLINVDVTLICERPKVKPHRQAMREKLSELLSVPLDCVSVKATTTEGLGFAGRGEGLAAQATVSVEVPASA